MHTIDPPTHLSGAARLCALASPLLAALFLGGCGGDTGTEPEPTPPRTPSSIALSANALTLDDGESGKLTATVRDQAGQPLTAAVQWSSSDEAVVTVADGTVRAERPGEATVTAAVGQLQASAGITVLQVATELRAIAGDAQAGEAGAVFHDSLVVRVLDRHESGVEGFAVRFSAGEGGGELSVAEVATDAAGFARAEWRAPTTAGSAAVEAEAVDGGLAAVTFTATVLPGAPAVVERVGEVESEVIAGHRFEGVSVRVEDRYGNAVPDAEVQWSVVAGVGAVEPASSRTGADGIASTSWATDAATLGTATIRAAVGEEGLAGLAVEYSTRTVAPLAPYSFGSNTDWVSPTRSARLEVIDAVGRVLPPERATYSFSNYTPGDPGGGLVALPDGSIGLRDLGRAVWGFRVRAAVGAEPVAGIALIVAHREPGERTVFETEHWRIVAPPEWIERATGRVPDFGAALDVGWEAQKELMGMTAEEANNAAVPGSPLLPQATAMEDPAVCGVSSIPLSFGRDCFVFPGTGRFADHPRWFIIFHEMGHASSISQQARAIFCQLLCVPGVGGTYTEGDASLLSMWSQHRMMEAPTLSEAARISVAGPFAEDTAAWERDLIRWEEETTPFSDDNKAFTANMWDAVHARLVREFGWGYVPRYVRTWRNDPYVRDVMDVDRGGPDLSKRSTFVAAAVSAAVRQDLRARFRAWRFPVDDALFDALYAHLSAAVDAPW